MLLKTVRLVLSILSITATVFAQAPSRPSGVRVVGLEPGVLHEEKEGVLLRRAAMTLESGLPAGPARVTIACRGVRTVTDLPALPTGRSVHDVAVAAADAKTTADVEIDAGGAAFRTSVDVAASRRWTVHVLPTAHVALGFTDLQENVFVRQAADVGRILDACREKPAFRWMLESLWPLEAFRAERPERFPELVARMKEGTIGAGALPVVPLTGLLSDEALLRLVEPAAAFRREHGIPLRSAVLAGTPAISGAVPSALAGAGIDRIAHARGPDAAAAGPARRAVPRVYRWTGPDGAAVLAASAPEGGARAAELGLTEGPDAVAARLPPFLRSLEEADYPFDAVLLHGVSGDNGPAEPRVADVAEAWNRRWTWPKIVLDVRGGFFDHIEKASAGRIPVVEGDGGVGAETGSASMPAETAMHLRNQEDLCVAEMLAALRDLVVPGSTYPAAAFRRLWRNVVLFAEPTWGSRESLIRSEDPDVRAQHAWKRRLAEEPAKTLPALEEEALRGLVASVEAREPSILVFNPQGGTATDLVRIVRPDLAPFGAVRTPDGALLPAQAAAGGGIVFIAPRVPALGYRSFVPSKSDGAALSAATFGTASIENAFFRATVDPATGGILSLLDKETRRELVDPAAPFRLGECAVVAGGGGVGAPDPPGARTSVLRPRDVRIERGADGPVFGSLIVRARGERLPSIETEITLYRDLRRVDLVVRLKKEAGRARESVWIAFPFRVEAPEVRMGVPGGTVVVGRGRLPWARRDLHLARNWIDLGFPQSTQHVLLATPDLPLVRLGDLLPGEAAEAVPPAAGRIFVCAAANDGPPGARAEPSGDLLARFSIAPWDGRRQAGPLPDMLGFGAVAERVGTQFGAQAARPFRATVLPSAREGILPPAGAFVEVGDPGTTVAAFRRSADGTAWLLRLRQVDPEEKTVDVRFPLVPFTSVRRAAPDETPGEELPVVNRRVRVRIPKRGTATLLLRTP